MAFGSAHREQQRSSDPEIVSKVDLLLDHDDGNYAEKQSWGQSSCFSVLTLLYLLFSMANAFYVEASEPESEKDRLTNVVVHGSIQLF